jgi:hypothetical protein
VDFSARVQNMQNQFNAGMADEFDNPNIDIPDESESGECEEAGTKMYEIVEANGAATTGAITLFKGGVDETATKFKAYTMVNTGRQDSCGSMMDALVLAPGKEAPGAKTLRSIPRGQGFQPESTVTGKINDESLPDPGATTSIGTPGLKAAFAGSASTMAAELRAGKATNAEAPQSAALGSNAERESSLGSFSSRIAGTDTSSGHIEEMDVQALVKNGGMAGLLAGRDPASESKEKAPPASARVPEASWNAGIPGTCYALDKCAGEKQGVKNAGECPAGKRYFRQSMPGGVCQRLPAK